jgi:hypothetical protein
MGETPLEEDLKGDRHCRNFAAATLGGQEVLFHLAASHGGRGYIDTPSLHQQHAARPRGVFGSGRCRGTQDRAG